MQDSSHKELIQIGLLSFVGLVLVAGAFTSGAYAQAQLASGNQNNSHSLFAAAAAAITGTSSVKPSTTLASATDNPPTETLQGNTTSPTDGILLNSFTLTANGGSNEYLHSVTVTPVTTPSSVPVSVVIQDLKLYLGTTLLSTATYSTSTPGTTPGSYTFSNINNLVLTSSSTELHIVADINPIDGKVFTQGAGVHVSVLAGSLDVETSNNAACTGNSLPVTGGSTGNVISFQTAGLVVGAPQTTATTTYISGNKVIGDFNFVFYVTAFGQDAYISSTTGAFTGGVYATSTVSVPISSSINSSAGRSTHGNFVIHAGQTSQFNILLQANGQGQTVYGKISTLKYGTSDANPYASKLTLPSSFVTSQVYIPG